MTKDELKPDLMVGWTLAGVDKRLWTGRLETGVVINNVTGLAPRGDVVFVIWKAKAADGESKHGNGYFPVDELYKLSEEDLALRTLAGIFG